MEASQPWSAIGMDMPACMLRLLLSGSVGARRIGHNGDRAIRSDLGRLVRCTASAAVIAAPAACAVGLRSASVNRKASRLNGMEGEQ